MRRNRTTLNDAEFLADLLEFLQGAVDLRKGVRGHEADADEFFTGRNTGRDHGIDEDAFILQHHTLAGETSLLTAHPLLKVIHTDDPAGWLLYALDSEGHWQPHAEMVFTPELSEAINAARRLLGLSEHPAPMSLAI